MATIRVKVRPNARASRLAQADDGSWVADVKAAPVDGKANDELVALDGQYAELHRKQLLEEELEHLGEEGERGEPGETVVGPNFSSA